MRELATNQDKISEKNVIIAFLVFLLLLLIAIFTNETWKQTNRYMELRIQTLKDQCGMRCQDAG